MRFWNIVTRLCAPTVRRWIPMAGFSLRQMNSCASIGLGKTTYSLIPRLGRASSKMIYSPGYETHRQTKVTMFYTILPTAVITGVQDPTLREGLRDEDVTPGILGFLATFAF